MIENMNLIIMKYRFSAEVKDMLLRAAADDVDLTQYAIEGYDHWQLGRIYVAIKKGLDLTYLLNKSLDFHQMEELIRALSKGVDVSDYADPSISALEMMGHTVSKIRKVNVKPYFMKDFNDDQLYEILVGIENGIDVSQYADEEIDADTMDAIKRDLMKKAGLNVDTELTNISCF